MSWLIEDMFFKPKSFCDMDTYLQPPPPECNIYNIMKSVGGLQPLKNVDNPVTSFVCEQGFVCLSSGTWTLVNVDLNFCLLSVGTVG